MDKGCPTRQPFLLLKNMTQVIVYIDGFNLYHAIDDLGDPKLKWLDLWCLSKSLLREGEVLKAVKYFSAFQTRRQDAYARHRTYVKALEHSGVIVQMGNFKYKPMQCLKCHSSWQRPEEKETDVHIAISMVSDAALDEFDRAILICADSDLAPAKRMIKAIKPKKEFFVAAPPGRYTSARDLSPAMEITKGRTRKCLFPVDLKDSAGNIIVSAPIQYR